MPKELTQAQKTKAKSLHKKGKNLREIAKALHTRKENVSTFFIKTKVGKRRPSPFWQQVKKVKLETGYTHKEATRFVYDAPKWGKRRHKNYQTTEQRIKHMAELRKTYDGPELTDKIREYEEEDVGLGETPK